MFSSRQLLLWEPVKWSWPTLGPIMQGCSSWCWTLPNVCPGSGPMPRLVLSAWGFFRVGGENSAPAAISVWARIVLCCACLFLFYFIFLQTANVLMYWFQCCALAFICLIKSAWNRFCTSAWRIKWKMNQSAPERRSFAHKHYKIISFYSILLEFPCSEIIIVKII